MTMIILKKGGIVKTMPATWTVRSKSELGVVYVVTRDDTGNFSCSCPDFEYRQHVCKHIRKIKMRVAGAKQKNKLRGLNHD